MKQNKEISKKLFIEELERPAYAGCITLAVGECCRKGFPGSELTKDPGEGVCLLKASKTT